MILFPLSNLSNNARMRRRRIIPAKAGMMPRGSYRLFKQLDFVFENDEQSEAGAVLSEQNIILFEVLYAHDGGDGVEFIPIEGFEQFDITQKFADSSLLHGSNLFRWDLMFYRNIAFESQ